MEENEMKLISLRMPITDIEKAKTVSKRKDLNLSQFIRKIVKREVQSYEAGRENLKNDYEQMRLSFFD